MKLCQCYVVSMQTTDTIYVSQCDDDSDFGPQCILTGPEHLQETDQSVLGALWERDGDMCYTVVCGEIWDVMSALEDNGYNVEEVG